MYYFVIEAAPKPEVKLLEPEVEAAYVGCYINFPIADGAELLARHYIERSGWAPGEKDTQQWVEANDYEDDPEGLQYFREAEEDGVSLVFHWYPPGTDEEEED
jgi:hypothetical protein